MSIHPAPIWLISLMLSVFALPLCACADDDAGNEQARAASTAATAAPSEPADAPETVSSQVIIGEPLPLLIDPPGYHARYSRDGSMIVYTSQVNGDPHIWIVPSTGGKATMIDTGMTGDCCTDLHPSGGIIAFDCYRPGTDGPPVLFTANLDGSGVRDLWNKPGASCHPCWTADGERIVFSGSTYPGSKIHSINPDGSDLQQLSDGPGEDWHPICSPDGEWLMFTSDRSGNHDIWIMPIAGGDPIQVTTDPANDDRPAWSPDSKWICFISERSGSIDIWIKPVSGGEAVRVSDGPGMETCPYWAPGGGSIIYNTWDVSVNRPEAFYTVPVEIE